MHHLSFTEITIEEMQQLKVEALRIGLTEVQLMDYVGLQLAEFIKQQYPKAQRPLLFIGPGGNGLHGLASVRFLLLLGYQPLVLLTHPQEKLSSLANQYLQLLSFSSVEITQLSDQNSQEVFDLADIFIDALLGVGRKGTLREPIAMLIKQVNAHYKPTISVDMPSGFNTEGNEMIRADETLTFGLPKKGMLHTSTKPSLGKLYLAQLGIPLNRYQQIGLSLPPKYLSSGGNIIQLA